MWTFKFCKGVKHAIHNIWNFLELSQLDIIEYFFTIFIFHFFFNLLTQCFRVIPLITLGFLDSELLEVKVSL